MTKRDWAKIEYYETECGFYRMVPTPFGDTWYQRYKHFGKWVWV